MLQHQEASMALVNYNGTLEYGSNELEFRLFDDAGAPETFDGPIYFKVKRIDETAYEYSRTGVITGNIVKFDVNIPTSLRAAADNAHEFENPVYDHSFSVRSAAKAYMSGLLNLVAVP